MLLKVVVGKDVFKKDCSWDFISSVKDDIKSIARWNPSDKAWVVTSTDANEVSKIIADIFGEDYEKILPQIKRAIEAAEKAKIEALRKEMLKYLKQGIFAVKAKEYLGKEKWKEAMRLFVWNKKFLLLDRNRVLQYVAENEIPQSRFVNAILSFMDKLGLIYFDEHVDFLFDIVDSVYADIERKKISKNSVVLEDSGEDVIVRFGRRLNDTELSVLYEELTTVYFTTDKYGDLREHKLRVINYDKLNSCYRVPYFAVDKVLKVCSKLRISRVVDEVGWVTEEIPQPEFNLTLYPFQEEAVSAWLDNDCKGVIVVPTGGGKTIIALAALQLIHVPTLICVPTIELARQWKEAIKRVLGINAGILGGGSKEIMPVTVAIYNSAVKEINAIKDKFDFVIFDECFTYDTPVLTDRGWIPIGEIVEKKMKVNVLTHNGRFMPITGWHKVPLIKPLVEVTLEDGTTITCTADHKFLTPKGWVEAKDLSSGDILYQYGQDPLSDMWENCIQSTETYETSAQYPFVTKSMSYLSKDFSKQTSIGRAHLGSTYRPTEKCKNIQTISLKEDKSRKMEFGSQKSDGKERTLEKSNQTNRYSEEPDIRDSAWGWFFRIPQQTKQKCEITYKAQYKTVQVHNVEIPNPKKSHKESSKDNGKWWLWHLCCRFIHNVPALSNRIISDCVSGGIKENQLELVKFDKSSNIFGNLDNGRWLLTSAGNINNYQPWKDFSRGSRNLTDLDGRKMEYPKQSLPNKTAKSSGNIKKVCFKPIKVACVTVYNTKHEIQNITYVYDITVDSDHTYVAGGVIVHNCHHVPAKTFKEVAFNIKARKRLGLSATPQRTDRNEALIYFSVGPVVYTAKYKELVKIGLASPLEFYTIYVDLSDDEVDRYSEAEVDNKIQEMMKVALMAKAKYGVLKQILQKHSGSKTLVFTQYLEQARKAYEVAREVTKAALITGETPAKERERAFRLFKEGNITTLVSTTVLDEGVDVPDAEVAIILSGSSTERQLIQRIGRVIRYHPNKVAKVYEVVAAATIETRHAENRRAVLKDYGIEHKLISF